MEKARALILDSELDKEMWGEAVYVATYLLNRSPTSTVNITPAEKWYGKRPDLSNLQVFGGKVYTKVLGKLKKLDNRGKEGIFIGYHSNAYRIWDPETRKIYTSHDVVFEKKNNARKTDTTAKNEKIQFELENDSHDEAEDEQENVTQTEEEIEEERENEANETSEESEASEGENEENERQNIERYNLRPRRNIKIHPKYQDYITEFDDEAMLTYSECLDDINSEKWIKAIKEEKDSLSKNETLNYVDRDKAKGKKIITSRWLFRKKENGRFKARLVARGCQQRAEETKFRDTFSPTVDIQSLRVLFAIAAQKQMHMQMFDVKTAFLYGELQEEVYMEIPEGYKKRKDKICLLKKALYGLKQAPSRWNKKLTTFLKEQGMFQMKSDQCIFKNETNSLYIAIHVDDGIIFGEDKQIQKIIKGLESQFEITKSENLRMYLRMEIEVTKDSISISQEQYAKRVLERYNMQNCKDKPTPMAVKPSVIVTEENESKFP